jgi:pyruvate formate lyase activating enzyme
VKESVLYDRLPGSKVRCNVCELRCVIPEGRRGACRTRLNRKGTLYTLIYGKVASAFADPIEKKPVYHFRPGTQILSMGTLGCNFRCPGCQNWEISHDSPDEIAGNLRELPPAVAVELAERSGCGAICWTYNDPTIWIEYTFDTALLARRRGLATAYITNGYATREQLDMIAPVLDIWRVDIKGFSRESYKAVAGIARWQAVLEMTARARHLRGLWVECVTNVTPGINDSDEVLRGIARWIRADLGPDTPWHVTRFYPHLELSHVEPTPIVTIERARAIGLEEGLRYVYVGNIPGHPGEDTYCHGCGERVIRRAGFAIAQATLVGGACPRCGTRIPGRFDAAVGPTSGRRTLLVAAPPPVRES